MTRYPINPTKALSCLLSRTLGWFQQAVPNPANKNIHVQTGVHCEEVGEFLSSITAKDFNTGEKLRAAVYAMNELGEHLKNNHDCIEFLDRVETLDGLCDQLVTATGVAHMLDMDVVGGLHEVNGSNWSKFTNGVPEFDANGKIKKGSGFYKPNLADFAT